MKIIAYAKEIDHKNFGNDALQLVKSFKINAFLFMPLLYLILILFSSMRELLTFYTILLDILLISIITLLISFVAIRGLRKTLYIIFAVIVLVGISGNGIYYATYGEIGSIYYVPMMFSEFAFVVEHALVESILVFVIVILVIALVYLKVDAIFPSQLRNEKKYQSIILKSLLVFSLLIVNTSMLNNAHIFNDKYSKDYAKYVKHFNDRDAAYVELYGILNYVTKDPVRDVIKSRYDYDTSGYIDDFTDDLNSNENIDILDIIYGNVNYDLTGINRGNNLVIIQLETLDYTGWEHYDNLNKLMDNSVFFKNFYSGTIGPGYTCATEFMVETGFLAYTKYSGGWTTGVCDTFAGVNFEQKGSLAGYFNDRGYTTKVLHNQKSVYSREKLYENYGYDEFITQEGTLPYRDTVLFERLNHEILEMSSTGESFLFKYIMVENHDSSRFPERYSSIHDTFINSGITPYVGFNDEHTLKLNTSTAINKVTDEYIGEFFKMLEENNLLDTTDVLIYADHDDYMMPYRYDMLESGGYRPDFANDHINHTPAFFYSKNLENYFGANENYISPMDLFTLIVNLYDFAEINGEYLRYGNDPMVNEQSYYYIYDTNGIMLSSDNISTNDSNYISYMYFHKERHDYANSLLESFLA